jgi:hypothetical protein
MSFLYIYKIGEHDAKQVLPGMLVPVRGRRRWGKCVGGRICCKYCVHMYVNGKMRPVETIPGLGGNKGV